MELSNSQRRFVANKTQQIEVWNIMLSVMPTIVEVAEKYDGKVINKRFFDALKTALNRDDLYVDRATYCSAHRIEINCHGSKLRYCAKGKSYLDECSFTIYPVPTVPQVEYIKDGRLNFARFVEAVENTKGLINERIDKMTKSLDNFETYIQEIDQLRKEIDERLAEIPYPIRPCVVFEKKV